MIYRYGVSIQDRGVILHFGIIFFELYLIHPSKMKHFKRIFAYRIPLESQCMYELNPERKKIKHFFGYMKLKDTK